MGRGGPLVGPKAQLFPKMRFEGPPNVCGLVCLNCSYFMAQVQQCVWYPVSIRNAKSDLMSVRNGK